MTQCICGSKRIASVNGKTSDCCCVHYKNADSDGYVPGDIGIGGGDYIEFDYCLDCGRIQSKEFPIKEEAFEQEEFTQR
jgi:hypothetical protein